MKQRKNHAVVLKPIANKRIEREECPACAKPKKDWNRRTDWRCCSTKCTEDFSKNYVICWGWQDLRSRVFQRDNHTCVKCDVKYSDIIRVVYYVKEGVIYPDWKQGYDSIEEVYFMSDEGDDSLFVADHIIPIALGGEEWDPDNIQTLCKYCNKIKTKDDAGDIAKLRRKEKLEAKGQRFLN